MKFVIGIEFGVFSTIKCNVEMQTEILAKFDHNLFLSCIITNFLCDGHIGFDWFSLQRNKEISFPNLIQIFHKIWIQAKKSFWYFLNSLTVSFEDQLVQVKLKNSSANPSAKRHPLIEFNFAQKFGGDSAKMSSENGQLQDELKAALKWVKNWRIVYIQISLLCLFSDFLNQFYLF